MVRQLVGYTKISLSKRLPIIKNIIDNTPISFNGYDVVIISRPKLKFSEYSDIENNIIKLMNEMVKK